MAAGEKILFAAFVLFKTNILLTNNVLCSTMYIRKAREVGQMNLDKWKSQIVRGTLEYCILLMLDKKVYYGYEILQELSQYPMIASTESTVYPLLRR